MKKQSDCTGLQWTRLSSKPLNTKRKRIDTSKSSKTSCRRGHEQRRKLKEKAEKEGLTDGVCCPWRKRTKDSTFLSERIEDVLEVASHFYGERLKTMGEKEREEGRLQEKSERRGRERAEAEKEEKRDKKEEKERREKGVEEDREEERERQREKQTGEARRKKILETRK